MLGRLLVKEEEMVEMLQPLGPPLNRRISQSLEANLSGIPPSISLASRVGEWGRVSLLQCPALTSSSRRRLGCVSMAAGVRRTGSGLGPHLRAPLLYGGGGDGLSRYRCPLLSRAYRACFLFTYQQGVSIVPKYSHFYLSLILCTRAETCR